jgi:Fe2+ transport system protein B
MMEGKEGWVYVLTNEAMPGLVKVGQTYKTPEIRAQELSSETGVAAQYVVVYKAFVPNYEQVEKIVHDKLKSAGKHYNKEFFKCEPFEAIRHIRDSTAIKFEESKEDVERKIQHQKSLEAQQEVERQRIAKEKERLETERRLTIEEAKRNQDLLEKKAKEDRSNQKVEAMQKIIAYVFVAPICIFGILFFAGVIWWGLNR